MKEMSITKAEWQVMRTIWANPGITTTEMIVILQELFNWKESTIKTLVARLKEKGCIERVEHTRPYRYSAILEEDQELRQELDYVLDNTCTKRQADLLIEVLRDRRFTASQLQEMIAVLEEKIPDAPVEMTCQCPAGQCSCRHL